MSNIEKIILTGDRPSGKLHLGHYVGSIQNRIKLQDQYNHCFYMIADSQAMTDNADHPEKIRKSVLEVALDNLALGLDPQKTTFFIQSQIPEIAELTVIFLNLVTLARLRRNPTVKNEMKQKGYGDDVPAGFLVYPVSQAADILSCRANLIPVGDDQLPMIEQVNEIVDKFNNNYGSTSFDKTQDKSLTTGGQVFSQVEPMLSQTPRLMGIDGKNKASKSLNNAIFFDDAGEVVKEKVMSMFTDTDHLRASDPGKVAGNMVFHYLDSFDPDQLGLQKLKEEYTIGGLGDVVLKKRLIDILENLIDPIRTKRRLLAKDPAAVMNILKEGTTKTRIITQETMRIVREAVKMDYF